MFSILVPSTQGKATLYRVHVEQFERKEEAVELANAGSLAYTICQTPVILAAGKQPGITVHRADGSRQHIEGHVLDAASSQHIFQRDGQVHHLTVVIGEG